jgi:fibronectin type III domain protein
MAKVRLGINSLSVPELIARARQIGKALTGNDHFANAQPMVAQITAAADELEAAHADAQAARQAAMTKTSILHEKSDALTGVLRQAAGYIESVAGDDETKILSAGVHIKSTTGSASTSDMVAPTGLSASAGDHEGEIDLIWDKVKGAKSYVLERSPDPSSATSWAHEAVTTKSSATVSGLVSGTRYWFRVAAVISAGQSGWSDPVIKMAP